jgi:hypothetical protein
MLRSFARTFTSSGISIIPTVVPAQTSSSYVGTATAAPG